MAWLTGWTYRKSITLARASGVVTNYQMKLLIGESSGATGEDVDCGGHCLSTFNDLRFTAADGTTLLPYWIESITGTTPNQLATVWIKFDSIGTDATSFYMYYGNSGASAASNGDDTFLFFDDFPDAAIDTDKWTIVAGEVTVSGSCVILTGTSGTRGIIVGKVFVPKPARFIAKARSSAAINATGYPLGNRNSGNTQYSNVYSDPSANNLRVVNCAGGAVDGVLVAVNDITQNHIYEKTWVTDEVKIYQDGVLKSTRTVNIPTDDMAIGLVEGTSVGVTWSIDFVFATDFLETEPAWGTWGVEYSTAEYYSVSITADPLSVTASLSGTPWPSLQQIIPAALSVTAGLLITSVSTQMVIAPAALSATAELSCGDITSFASANIVTTYECYLSKPTYADLALPMSSFQGRFKSGDPSMLSVVIPGEDKFEDINDRSGGTLKLYIVKTAASNKVKELLIAVTLEDIRIDKGTENISISLSGHATVTYTPKIVVIKDLYYENIINGLRRWRFNPYVYLRPGDTVYIDGSTIVADDISWSVSENSFAMECAERTGGGTALDTTAAWVLKADSSPSSGGALAM